MKFGVNSFIWSDRFTPEQFPLLARLKNAGFDGIEVPMFSADTLSDPEVQRALRESGLERTVCSVLPAGLSLISDDAQVWKGALEHLRSCIHGCAEIGAHVIAGPLYSPVGYLPGRRRTADEWKRAVEAYQRLGPDLDAAAVVLAIEPLNRYETYFLNTAADTALLCAEVDHPRVGMLFDTYHANIEEKSVPDAIRAAGKHILHFHSCENDRGVPGTGHIDWPNVFAALRDIHYDRWLTIESFGFSVGALSAAASIWRDLAPAAEDIAFEGLHFLRKRATSAASGTVSTGTIPGFENRSPNLMFCE